MRKRIDENYVQLGPAQEEWPVRDFTIRRGLCNYCRFFLREWPSWPSHDEWQVAYPGDIILQDHEYFRGSAFRLRSHTDFNYSGLTDYQFTRNTCTFNYHECEFCALIHATLSLDIMSDHRWVDMFAASSQEGASRVLIRHGLGDLERCLTLKCVTYLDTNTFTREDLCDTLTIDSGDTKFLENWRTCLDQCCRLRAHGPKEAWVPKRLVQVTWRCDGSSPAVCIRESATLKNSPRYLTLSHRWGRNAEFILTKSNQESLRSSIPWSLIPKTYQDALLITLRMGFNYLWIDSLCILQDSTDDWRSESLLMSKIYGNTSMNIYASCSADEYAGIFRKRDPAHIATSAFQCHWPGMTGSLWSLGLDPSTLYRSNFLSASRSFLSSRGWVVQEELLPPAVLYLGTTSVLWICIHGYTSETHFGPVHPASDVFKIDQIQLRDLVSVKAVLQQLECEADVSEDVFRRVERLWGRIVRRFNVCDLKYATDKLVAISGMAQIMCSILHLAPDSYLAGVWKPRLMHQLLWHRPKQSLTAVHPHLFAPDTDLMYDTYVAPSWSWASVQGEVKTPRKKGHELVHLVEANTVAPAGPFGQISSGNIVVHGPLWEIRDSTAQNRLMTMSCGHEIKFTPRTATGFDFVNVKLDRPILNQLPACSFGFFLLGLRLQGIPLSFRTSGHEKRSACTHGWLKLTGLLLERICKRKGEYRRIGRVSLPLDKMMHSNCQGHKLSGDCYLDHSLHQEVLPQAALEEACTDEDKFAVIYELPGGDKEKFLAASSQWTSFGNIEWSHDYADPKNYGKLLEDFYTIRLV